MPPPLTPSPPELINRFEELAGLAPEADRRQMFGYPICTVHGHMFMGLHRNVLILRLSDDDRQEFLDRYRATLFEPMPGRPMREYVVVPADLLAGDNILPWVPRALDHASGLPPKPPTKAKPPRKKGRTTDAQR